MLTTAYETDTTVVTTKPVTLEPEAIINIENLRLRTYIGFNEDEVKKKQDVVINVCIRYLMSAQCMDDQVDEALNYKTITKAIIALVENGRFLLLEKLVADVVTLCAQPDAVTHAQVRIEKPHALRFADSVSLTLEYNRR